MQVPLRALPLLRSHIQIYFRCTQIHALTKSWWDHRRKYKPAAWLFSKKKSYEWDWSTGQLLRVTTDAQALSSGLIRGSFSLLSEELQISSQLPSSKERQGSQSWPRTTLEVTPCLNMKECFWWPPPYKGKKRRCKCQSQREERSGCTQMTAVYLLIAPAAG